MPPITVASIKAMKNNRKIVALTALDMPTASWCGQDERDAGGSRPQGPAPVVDIVLVGDSLGMVSLGLDDTTQVTMEMMLTATRAVARGLGSENRPLLVVDMPLEGFRNVSENAVRFRDAGADAIKIECHEAGMAAIKSLVDEGFDVMAHVGLLPQEVEKIGGYRLQGKSHDAAERIIATALLAEQFGAFSCVVEKVPQELGRTITERLLIPTIGIGAGADCDGQILVMYDLLGIFSRFRPKFVRRYAELGQEASEAIRRYADDVRAGSFPSEGESF